MLILVWSGSLAAKLGEKTSIKLEYSVKTAIRALSTIIKTIKTIQKGWIFCLELAREVIWTKNFLLFELRAVTINFFSLTNSTSLVVIRVAIVIYNL